MKDDIELFRRHAKVCGNSECRDVSPRGKDPEEADRLAVGAGWGKINDIWHCPQHQGPDEDVGVPPPSPIDLLLGIAVEAMTLPMEELTKQSVIGLDRIFSMARAGLVTQGVDIDRKSLFTTLLQKTNVYVFIFPHPELQVPEGLGFPLTLEYGLNMPNPISDLALEEKGIRATLSFNRTPILTFVPWRSIGAIGGCNPLRLFWSDAQEGFTIEHYAQGMRLESGNETEQRVRPRLSLVPDDNKE